MTTAIFITTAAGHRVPSIGLGLWKIENDQAATMVHEAILAGYRHLDSACDYGNEQQVGEGIEAVLKAGVCTRDELWITSKLWNTFHRPEHVRLAIEKTLRDLRVSHLDLYLIHFPIPLKYVPIETRYPPGWIYDPKMDRPSMQPAQLPIAETWGAMEALQTAGLTKSIGICNFNISIIRDLLSTAAIRPELLQVESHPYLTQEKLLRYCQQESIAVTAFSPLGAGSYVSLGMATEDDSVLGQAIVQQLAKKYAKSAAQIVLRWGVQRGTSVIPKTSHVARLAENIDVFDFILTDEEMQQLSGLNRNQRFNDPGDFCEAAFGCFYPIYE